MILCFLLSWDIPAYGTPSVRALSLGWDMSLMVGDTISDLTVFPRVSRNKMAWANLDSIACLGFANQDWVIAYRLFETDSLRFGNPLKIYGNLMVSRRFGRVWAFSRTGLSLVRYVGYWLYSRDEHGFPVDSTYYEYGHSRHINGELGLSASLGPWKTSLSAGYGPTDELWHIWRWGGNLEQHSKRWGYRLNFSWLNRIGLGQDNNPALLLCWEMNTRREEWADTTLDYGQVDTLIWNMAWMDSNHWFFAGVAQRVRLGDDATLWLGFNNQVAYMRTCAEGWDYMPSWDSIWVECCGSGWGILWRVPGALEVGLGNPDKRLFLRLNMGISHYLHISKGGVTSYPIQVYGSGGLGFRLYNRLGVDFRSKSTDLTETTAYRYSVYYLF